VLDLSDTLAADDGARAALLSLRALLADGHTCLRLVLPEGEARAALCSNGAASVIGIDALHTSVRAAILAAHAALPGPALVTPALRAMLSQPPELVLPPRLFATGVSSGPGMWHPGRREPRPVRPISRVMRAAGQRGTAVSPNGGNRPRS
jgi:hypothetical protein